MIQYPSGRQMTTWAAHLDHLRDLNSSYSLPRTMRQLKYLLTVQPPSSWFYFLTFSLCTYGAKVSIGILYRILGPLHSLPSQAECLVLSAVSSLHPPLTATVRATMTHHLCASPRRRDTPPRRVALNFLTFPSSLGPSHLSPSCLCCSSLL